MAISLHPRDFVMGGLIDDVDVEIKDSRFIVTDYSGAATENALALQLTMTVLGDDSGAVHEQLFSAGRSADFLPDPETEGRTLIQNGTRESLTNSTNLALFLKSMADAGADLAILSAGDIGVLTGARLHVKRMPAPKRDNIVQQPRSDGRERANTILLCTKLISLPWDKKGGAKGVSTTAKGTGAAAAKAEPAESSAQQEDGYSEELLTAALSWLGEDLTENSESTLGQLKLRATRNLKSFGLKPGREANAFVAHITSAQFLEDNGFVVDRDAKTVQMP